MLKEPEELIKRRKLSLTHATDASAVGVAIGVAATATPPITPPTPPLNMMLTPTTTTTKTSASTNAADTMAHAAAAIAGSAADTTTTTACSAVPDHYSLRWNNHQNHILRAFDALLQTKTLVDVTLVCAETSIRAHKMVLSACSPFFQRVFAETPCKHPVIVLKDFRGWVVQAIVDFMYRGEISVPQERLQTLIQAGESLQVRGLVESSVPEHTPTPAASPDDFALLDTSLMSSELERCSSFDDESPSMVTSGSKIILPSRLFGSAARRDQRERERERKREREREQEREHESDQELHHETNAHSDLCTSPMPRRKQARPRRRSGDLPLELASKPASPLPQEELPQPTFQPEQEEVGHVHQKEQDECALPLPQQQEQQQHREPEQEQPMQLTQERNSTPAEQIEALKTVIKRELIEAMHDESDAHNDDACDERTQERDVHAEAETQHDSGNGNDSHEHNMSLEKCNYDLSNQQHNEAHEQHSLNLTQETMSGDLQHEERQQDDEEEMDDDEEELPEDHDDPEPEPEDIEELIQTTNELRHKTLAASYADGPEDLCTTKKDTDTSGAHTASDAESSPTSNNNNNNNSSKQNNNNRIVLSLKDIRHLNKPASTSTPNANNSMNPFAATSLRDLRLERAANAVENQCKMEALEAQMHAAAAAAAAAAANGENPFQHMEHQMDLSLAAAAAAAAVSHQQSRELDEAMQREQRELQQQHNAYANSLLGQMGMPGMPPFGPGSGGPGGGPGTAPHERLEESINRLSKEFAPTSPMSLPTHFNPPDGQQHPPSPLPFPVFGLDSPLGLFPPGIDPGKLYNPLMEMSDPRGMPGDPPPFLKKKIPRPKGQHSAPRGGPPRSWTNAELTEALQHVWNKKMTTSQASRIFGIPYNSLLMYVRGKYGKSLKLEQLRKDCISGPPLELLQMGISSGGGGGGSSKSSKSRAAREVAERDAEAREKEQRGSSSADMELGLGPLGPMGPGPGGPRSASSEPDLLGGPNSIFNPFNPQGFYPDFPGGFPGLPLSMLNLLPPAERHHAAAAMHHLSMDEDCKSDRSKQSSSMDEEFGGGGGQPLALNRMDDVRREALTCSGSAIAAGAQQNGGAQD